MHSVIQTLLASRRLEDVERERSRAHIQREAKPRMITIKNAANENTSGALSMTDSVNHPPHYNQGKIEVLEFLEDQNLGYHRACVVKYICRAGYKDATKEIEDLQKALFYLRREIELLTAESEGRDPVRPNDMGKAKP